MENFILKSGVNVQKSLRTTDLKTRQFVYLGCKNDSSRGEIKKVVPVQSLTTARFHSKRYFNLVHIVSVLLIESK